MSNKKYTVKYYKGDKPIVFKANRSGITELLSGDAKGCFMEVKISDNMPVDLHNLIAKHNQKTIKNEQQ